MRLRYGQRISALHKQSRRLPLLPSILCSLICVAAAKADDVILRVNSDGPRTTVSQIVFCDEGKRLLTAGWDKTVQNWTALPSGKFVLDAPATIRIPIGPAQAGAINTISVSDDGQWIAVGGQGLIRRSSNFRDVGRIFPMDSAMTEEMLLDQGVINLVDRSSGRQKQLRGHIAPVNRLTFAHDDQNQSILFSLAATTDDERTEYVVKRWTLQGVTVAETKFSVDAPVGVPQISVLANGSQSPSVAISTGTDDRLRVWDGKSKKIVSIVNGVLTSCVVAAEQDDQCFTGAGASLRRWQVKNGQFTLLNDLRLPNVDDLLWLPQSLARVKSKTGEKLVLGAVGGKSGTLKKASLFVFGLPIQNKAQPERTVKLWDIRTEKPPAISLEPSQQRGLFGVSGNPNHSVAIFNIDSVLEGNAKPQVLATQFRSIEKISFGSQADQPILLFQEHNHSAWNLCLNLITQELVEKSDDTEWVETATNSPSPVAIEQTDNGTTKYQFAVTGKPVQIELKSEQAISKVAIPPDNSVLAVATHINGQDPRLTVYDCKTGDAIRELKGHSERINSIAFSGDSKRLASSARDRTICVWDMSTLDEVRAVSGTLKRISVDRDQVVTAVKSPPQQNEPPSQIRVGDKLVGIADTQVEWKSSFEMLQALWRLKPGTSANVKVMRNGQRIQLPLQIGQASDERKPLFSVILSREKQDDLRWIGWNPLGPFYTSHNALMSKIGWHFNTTDPQTPVRFADVGKYRNQYFRPDLITELFETGKIPQRPLPPEPKLSLMLSPGDYFAGNLRDNPLIREQVEQVVLSVSDNYPADHLKGVKFTLDGMEVIGKEEAGLWLATVPASFRKRGKHTVVASLVTIDADTRNFREQIQIDYVPAEIKIELNEGPVRTKNQQHAFRATVIPTLDDEELDIRLRYGGGKTKQWKGKGRQKIQFVIPLDIGDNEVVFGVKPTSQDLGLEEQIRYIQIHRSPKRVAPPAVAMTNIQQLLGSLQDSVPVRRKQATVVSVPICKVLARISSETEPISKVNVSINGAKIPLKNQKQIGLNRQVDLAESIRFAPGKNVIRISAQSANSDVATEEHVIEFRPQIPEIAILGPAEGFIISEFLFAPVVAFEASLDSLTPLGPNDTASDFSVSVAVNNKRVIFRKDFKAPRIHENLQSRFPIRFGTNEVTVKATNRWRPSESKTESVKFRYLPQPVLRNVKARAIPGVPSFQAQVDVRTAFAVTEVFFNDVPVRNFKVTDKQGQNLVLSLPTLDYITNRKSVPLRVVCGEVSSDVELAIPEAPLPPAPELDYVVPSGSILEPEFRLTLNVLSQSPITNLVVRRDDEVIFDNPNSKMPADLRIPLTSIGIKTIRITASNSGGTTDEKFTINYVQSPASISITHVEVGDQKFPVEFVNGRQTLPNAVDANQVWISGRIQWSGANSPLQTKSQSLRMMVNGYQQMPFELETPKNPNETQISFRAPIFLSDLSNEVSVDLFDAELETGDRARLHIDCSKPVAAGDQTLRLVIIQAGSSDKEALMKEVTGSLGIARVNRKWANKVFDDVIFEQNSIQARDRIRYGDIETAILFHRIAQQQEQAKILQRDKKEIHPPNEVVAVYFRGTQIVSRDGREYLMESPARGKRSGFFPLDNLQRCLKRVSGAKFFLTDLKDSPLGGELAPRTPSPPAAPWAAAMGCTVQVTVEPKMLIDAIARAKGKMAAKQIRVDQLGQELDKLAKSEGYTYRQLIPFPVEAIKF